MRPNPHSSTPSTALPTTHCSYFPVQNPQRKSSASQERLPSTTSQIDYQALNMHIGLYNKPTQYDFKLAEASHANPAPTSAQRYNYQSQDHQVLMRKSSASPTPYEVHIETRRGSAQVQSIQNQLQTSQSSNNVQWKAESKQPDFLFTFKKDAQNQFFNLSDVSSVHYASAEQPDTVVTKMFSAESRKGKLEPQQENTETTLNLPGSDFKSNKLTEPANKPKIAVDTPTKLIACLEMLDTPSTPPKREKKSQAATDYFSNPSQQNYMESPELLRQQSRERISKPAVNVNNQVKPPSLGSEVNPFGFESVGKEYESKNSIGNPSYCTQSPSIKYQSHHPVRNNFAMETKNYDKEIEINPGSVNAFMSQGPELKKSSEHNYYSYLSLITVHSSEDQGKEYRSAGKRSASSQKQMNSSQELAMQNVKNSPGKSKQGEKTSQNSLRNVLKPNVSVSDFESTENKKRVASGDFAQNEDTKNYESVADSASTQKKSSPVRNIRESKSLEKYCSVGSNIQSSVSGIDTDSKESTDQWLLSANERARQILNRLPQKSSLSPPLMAVTRQQSDNKNFDSLKKEEESKVEVTSQAETGVKKSLLKACGMKVKSTGNVQIKISDLIAQSNNEPQITTSDKDKEKEAEKPAKINLTSCPQPASLTFGEDLSGERSSKTSDSLRPAFFKEKILESSVLDKEKEKKQGVPTMKMPTRTNSHESIKDYRRGSINSNITKGNGNLDTSDMQYSESQGSSNNMVCIGSRVVTKEGESRQVTEESPFAGGKEVFPIIVSQRQCENKEEMRGSVKQENDVEEKRTYLCSSLKENEFAVPNQQVAANTSDLEELQKSLMSKIEGIHSDIIEKINKISDKIDLEMSHCGPVHMDGTASPYMNHSFSEMPSHYLPQAKNVEVKQHYNNNSIFIEGSNQRQTDNTTSSEIYEYDSQSRTYSIRPPLPLQASNINKQPSEAKPFLAYSQRSGVNMENPFSNRSSNFPISRDRQYSNCNSVTTSNNVSICLEQLALESQEKRSAGTTRESFHQRPPKPSENRSVQQNISTSPYGKVQKNDIKSKVASVIPRDLPKPLSTKSQNKPSYSKPELYAQYSSQTDISDRFKKNNGFSHSGASQKGLMDKGGLNLSVKSFSEKKESLESELNRSWGTNVRLSAKRHSVGPKEDAPPIESSPLEKVTRSSMSSHNPEKMMVLFNSSPIVHDKEGEQRGEQRKAYWIMSPDFSFPGSRDSSRQLESGGSTHHSLGQVHSVNHEMQRLEKKLEKYLKAGNSFESLEPIREMSNSETYYNQGLGSRNSSVNKIDGNVSQMKKSEGTQSVKMINRWNVKEKEVMSNRGGNYGQTLRGDKKNTSSSGSFKKERPDREETSGERVRGGSREGSQGKGYGAQMLNKKVKGMLHENSVKGVARKSFYY